MNSIKIQEKNESSSELLTIYLACHNRTSFLSDAIESLISQSNCDFRLIISDNSTDDKVQDFIRIHYPYLEYIRRNPFLLADAHGNAMFKEFKTEFIMIMHDDDLLHRDFVREVKNEISSNKDYDIFATNGQFISQNGILLSRQFFYSRKLRVVTSYQEELIAGWFSYGSLGVAPFPSYIYRSSAIKSCECDILKYGQYADFWLIMSLLSCGSKISWLNKRLYLYRIHDGQDSSSISFRTYSKLKINTRIFFRKHYLSPNFTLIRLGHLLTLSNSSHSKKKIYKRLFKIKIFYLLANPVLIIRGLFSKFLLTSFLH
jgi:glycosyltransferase involved in cell wall biosynthesis